MIKLATLFCFSLVLFASETLSFGVKNEQKEEEKITAYAIQLFSASSMELAEKALKKVPKELQSQSYIQKIGDYIALRYSQSLSYSKMKPQLEQFHNAGFKDAYILEVDAALKNINNGIIHSSVKEEPLQNTQSKVETKNEMSQFSKSTILLKAQNAHERGDDSEAMIYYEMLLASGVTNQKIKNNLCYLYGKRGAWFEAKAIIDSEQYYGKLIYAYAYGAVESTQENYYNELSPYIMIDKSGQLMLLTGYYFEKKEDMQRALSFYKMAYEKNPTDVYNIFVYARALDMRQDENALPLYKKILQKVDNSHALYAAINKRVIELGN